MFTGAYGVRVISWYGIDVCYCADDNHNYTKRHHYLNLNGIGFGGRPIEEDRALHQYAFRFTSPGGRLGVLLQPGYMFGSNRARDASEVTGSIQLSVMPMTASE